MQSTQRLDRQLALQRTALASKNLAVNNNASRHKGRMILFSAFEVKAATVENSLFADFSVSPTRLPA
jgi:hypothetical protein